MKNKGFSLHLPNHSSVVRFWLFQITPRLCGSIKQGENLGIVVILYLVVHFFMRRMFSQPLRELHVYGSLACLGP